MLQLNTITIYTDGSCNPTFGIGGWASILLTGEEKIVLSGREENTTHQRMELMAVIKAIEYIIEYKMDVGRITFYTDSQYVKGLIDREKKLVSSGFETKKKLPLRNNDLVKVFFQYVNRFETFFVKVKAHQKKSDEENVNREVDMLCRKIIREYVKERNQT